MTEEQAARIQQLKAQRAAAQEPNRRRAHPARRARLVAGASGVAAMALMTGVMYADSARTTTTAATASTATGVGTASTGTKAATVASTVTAASPARPSASASTSSHGS